VHRRDVERREGYQRDRADHGNTRAPLPLLLVDGAAGRAPGDPIPIFTA
jgi:hypothetical protein